jgi:hypothetical protein
MDLSVTVGMQQHSILGTVRSSTRAPDDVVVVPPRHGGDELAAYRAAALLVAPEVKRLPIAPEVGHHLSTYRENTPRYGVRISHSLREWFKNPVDPAITKLL